MSEPIDPAQPRIIQLDDRETVRKAEEALMLARARAIDAYADIEQSLSRLLATLLQTDPAAAGIIFFRVVNTRARLTILEDLLKRRHAEKYKGFWNSLVKLIHSVDSTRNEVVHWHVVHSIREEHGYGSVFYLATPNFWLHRQTSGKLTANDLSAFTVKALFIRRLLDTWVAWLQDHVPLEHANAWRDIFQQPVVYPPPSTHPLNQTS